MSTRSKPAVMSFWDDEYCEYCHGTIIEKTVALSRKVKGKHVILENVPAGVCKECGTRYYAANVLKTVEATLRGRGSKVRKELVSVFSL